MSDLVRYIREQFFEWGSMRWFFEPGDLETESLSVCIATFKPGSVQKKHPHFREEQILYVISGTGRHYVGGREEILGPGSIRHFPPYAEHGMANPSDTEDLVILLVYSPSRIRPLLDFSDGRLESQLAGLFAADIHKYGQDYAILDPLGAALAGALAAENSGGMVSEGPAGEKPGRLAAGGASFNRPASDVPSWDENILNLFDPEGLSAIQSTMERLAAGMGLSLALLTTSGQVIIKTANHPKLCTALAARGNGSYCQAQLKGMFEYLLALPPESLGKPHFFTCCSSIVSTIIPIVYRRKIQAYMKCGEIFLTGGAREEMRLKLQSMESADAAELARLLSYADGIAIEPKNRLYAAAEAAMAIAGTISGMASSALRRKELDESRLSLAREQLATATLEKALREADIKLLKSQLTPHFLFNTLNTIAQMAYIEDSPKVAELAWNLSDLLRTTLRKSEELIPLAEELGLLRNYLHIQSVRFGDRISFDIEAEKGTENLLVPCMIFQPLVENSIIHGLEPMLEEGRVTLRISRHGDRLLSVVEDNGVGFDMEATARAARPAGRPGAGNIGLRSTRSRLEHYFSGDYRLEIHSAPGKGTRVEMDFATSEGMPRGTD